jgi:hypothetical protein
MTSPVLEDRERNLRCVKCGHEQAVDEPGWRAYLTDDEDEPGRPFAGLGARPPFRRRSQRESGTRSVDAPVLATTERLREQIAQQVAARRAEPSRSFPENQVDDRRSLICEQTRKSS